MATSPTIRRSQHRLELRTLILDSARDLFVRDGFEAFSMRKLAASVGYSPASIYQHFSGKDALFQCLVEESFQALAASLARAAVHAGGTADSDPVVRLHRGLRAYVQFGVEHPNEYRFAFMMAPVAARGEAAIGAFQSLRSRVEACLQAGRFRPIDPDLAAQTLWVAVHGVTALLIVRPHFPWVDRNSLIEQVIHNATFALVVPEA